MKSTNNEKKLQCPQCGSVEIAPKAADTFLFRFLNGVLTFVLDLFSPGPNSIFLKQYNSAKAGYICQKCGCIFKEGNG